MRGYLVGLENRSRCSPKQKVQVLIGLRKDSDAFGAVIKNLRVTDLALEFDLYASEGDSKDKAISALSEKYGRLLNERDLQHQDSEPPSASNQPSQYESSKEETVKLCVKLFNEQRFWECHETLEQIWRRQRSGDEKDVQQGIILAASALVHFQKGEPDVCLGMIPRALAKLDRWKEDSYYSLDLMKLRESLREMQRTGIITIPRI